MFSDYYLGSVFYFETLIFGLLSWLSSLDLSLGKTAFSDRAKCDIGFDVLKGDFIVSCEQRLSSSDSSMIDLWSPISKFLVFVKEVELLRSSSKNGAAA